MAKKDDNLPQNYGPTDEPEQFRDYSYDEVPEDPNAGQYPEREELPQSEVDADEAKDSVTRKEPPNRFGAGVGDLKGNAIEAGKRKLVEKVPGGEKAQEAVEKTEQAVKFSKNIAEDAKKMAAAAKSAVAVFGNPYTWIAILAALVVGVIIVSIIAVGQVYGQTKSTTEAGISAGAMQQRLAQRAEWLQQNVQNYPNSGALTSTAPGPKGGLGSNPWGAACPQIVQLIYGLSPYLTGWMGANNAYKNYSAHPEMYEAWAFSGGSGEYGAYGNGTTSAGATLQNPPPGAIVSIENSPAWYNTCCPGAGHTFVMLTDELVGPRILDDTMRSHIVGWALPKGEGFEGSFITGSFDGMAPEAPAQSPQPGLPPVPAYMGEVIGTPPGGGGGNYDGPADRAAWMKAAGIAESDWQYVDYIAMKESSWNPNATNASSGACGLIQALPCSKVPGNGYDPVDNLRWADGYAKNRYGSWQAAHQFWQANHWW
jgi:hypothetical protein